MHAASLLSTEMFRPIDYARPVLQESSWRLACSEVLEQIGIGVIACDASLRILGLTSRAAQLLACLAPGYHPSPGDELPSALHLTAEAWRERRGAERVELVGSGRAAIYAGFRMSRMPEIGLLIHLRAEVDRDHAMAAALRELAPLTARDLQVIGLTRQGKSNKQVAAALGLTSGTVRNYLHRICRSLNLSSRAELIALVESLRERV